MLLLFFPKLYLSIMMNLIKFMDLLFLEDTPGGFGISAPPLLVVGFGRARRVGPGCTTPGVGSAIRSQTNKN